jgi:Mg2+/Co2+ transporter CorC
MADKKIIAHTASGEPLTREDYIRLIKEAKAENDLITQEELKKLVKSWKDG